MDLAIPDGALPGGGLGSLEYKYAVLKPEQSYRFTISITYLRLIDLERKTVYRSFCHNSSKNLVDSANMANSEAQTREWWNRFPVELRGIVVEQTPPSDLMNMLHASKSNEKALGMIVDPSIKVLGSKQDTVSLPLLARFLFAADPKNAQDRRFIRIIWDAYERVEKSRNEKSKFGPKDYDDVNYCSWRDGRYFEYGVFYYGYGTLDGLAAAIGDVKYIQLLDSLRGPNSEQPDSKQPDAVQPHDVRQLRSCTLLSWPMTNAWNTRKPTAKKVNPFRGHTSCEKHEEMGITGDPVCETTADIALICGKDAMLLHLLQKDYVLNTTVSYGNARHWQTPGVGSAEWLEFLLERACKRLLVDTVRYILEKYSSDVTIPIATKALKRVTTAKPGENEGPDDAIIKQLNKYIVIVNSYRESPSGPNPGNTEASRVAKQTRPALELVNLNDPRASSTSPG
ncbi:hypothetical protein F5Y18DRAFT_383723 [Xylariaceae sp. FL1019]|nr:hypothetical protein F5Y18DRAFT_383723 [Xylariaceae sp. FL1019]